MSLDRRRFLAITAAIAVPPVPALAAPRETPGDGDEAIVAALRKVREDAKLPGLIGAIVEPGMAARAGSVGVRKDGAPEAFRATDLVHLGSCTKAMTATMIAALVDEGRLAWGSTLAQVFPDAKLHPDFGPVTLTQLLTHRAGLPSNVAWQGLAKGKTPAEQRREVLDRVASVAPPHVPGSKMVYSNVGYALAGLMAETVAKASWDDLMRDRLFRPLKMDSAGFGPPGTPGQVDQPWGHSRILGMLLPSQSDNPPALGPAGTVHCSMGDWAKFAELHIRGARGEKTAILKPETFATLQTPAKREDYAKGWGVADREWAGGTVLMHSGSNTKWFAVAWLAPRRNVGFLAATNFGGIAAQGATDEAIAAMLDLKR